MWHIRKSLMKDLKKSWNSASMVDCNRRAILLQISYHTKYETLAGCVCILRSFIIFIWHLKAIVVGEGRGGGDKPLFCLSVKCKEVKRVDDAMMSMSSEKSKKWSHVVKFNLTRVRHRSDNGGNIHTCMHHSDWLSQCHRRLSGELGAAGHKNGHETAKRVSLSLTCLQTFAPQWYFQHCLRWCSGVTH